METGESITDYISILRINKSIEYIINTNLKAYEIAEKVGIRDPHYFSICFKKYTGNSINEYKKSINA
jgi:two-component system response regulator YesN